jgi:hypothetical protein
MSLWVIELLVNLLSPHPGTLACPSTPEVLWARERAPTSYSSVIFTLDLHLSLSKELGSASSCITNFMGHDLAIIVMWNFFFMNLYGIDMDVIHLFVLFEHECYVHCLDSNVICLFILFKHKCCMFIRVIYTQNLCTWFMRLNIAQHSCSNNMNLWNNIIHIDLEWTHEAYKFVMRNKCFISVFKLWKMTNKSTCNWETYNKLVNG